MADVLINLKNAYHAAMVMMDIDPSFIKSIHKNDVIIFMDDLKKALDDYEKPFTLPVENDPTTKLDKYLSDLLKATQNIYHLLTDEGKNFVETYLKG